MDTCAKCGTPMEADSQCSCEPSLCYHCCACPPDCTCGCSNMIKDEEEEGDDDEEMDEDEMDDEEEEDEE
jgi:hypothetical protein